MITRGTLYEYFVIWQIDIEVGCQEVLLKFLYETRMICV